MVIVVAPETFQLRVVRCPWLMLVGLASKELIVGGDTGCSVVDSGSGLTIEMQPLVEPINVISDARIAIQNHLRFIIQSSGFSPL
jgi:hypothetical protein